MIKRCTCNVSYLVLSILLLTAAPGQSQTPRLADEHINRGNALFDKGDLVGAIGEYDKAIALNPKQAYYYYNRGNARKDRGDFDEAISDYEKALSLDLKVPEVYNNRGVARLEKEDLDGAISDFTKALSLKPDHANAYSNRGYARQQKGMLTERSVITRKPFGLTRMMLIFTRIAVARAWPGAISPELHAT